MGDARGSDGSTATVVRTYTIYEVPDHLVAIEASAVLDFIELAPVFPLPFTSGGVEGLVNAAGRVLVQLDLGVRALATRPLGPDEGGLAVVTLAGVAHALHVTGLVATIELPDDLPDVPASSRYGAALPSPGRRGREAAGPSCIRGQVEWSGLTVHVIACERLTFQREDAVLPLPSPGLLGTSLAAGRDAVGAPSAAPDGASEWLVVSAGALDVAVPVAEVREIADVGEIRPLPVDAPEIVGVLGLRGTPLLVVSLGVLLGGERGARANTARLVVLHHEDATVSVLVDRVHGIRRGAAARLVPVGDAREGLLGYVMVGGEPIVALSLKQRLAARASDSLRRCATSPSAAATRAIAAESTTTLLDVRVAASRFLLPIESVERLIEYREASPVPATAGGRIDAVLDVAGAILPVLDLRIRLGAPKRESRTTAGIVIRALGERWVLVVDQIHRLVNLEARQIETLGAGRTRGCVDAVARLDGEPVGVLSPDRIVSGETVPLAPVVGDAA